MLKKMFALTSAVTVLAGAAYAGPSCCASKTATKSANAGTKSCCVAKAKQTSAQKSAKVTNVKATKPKLTQVRVCPMTGEAVVGKGAGSQVVGKYNVHFCCEGCKPAFNKLSKAEQQKKIQAALKKQNAA